MKGLALAGIYIASIGVIATGIETGRIEEEWAGALYLIWGAVGLVTVVIVALRRDDSS